MCYENEIKSKEETLCQYFPLIITTSPYPAFVILFVRQTPKIAVLESVCVL